MPTLKLETGDLIELPSAKPKYRFSVVTGGFGTHTAHRKLFGVFGSTKDEAIEFYKRSKIINAIEKHRRNVLTVKLGITRFYLGSTYDPEGYIHRKNDEKHITQLNLKDIQEEIDERVEHALSRLFDLDIVRDYLIAMIMRKPKENVQMLKYYFNDFDEYELIDMIDKIGKQSKLDEKIGIKHSDARMRE